MTFHSLILLLADCLRTSILVTGLVIIMMMLIEVFNLRSEGRMMGSLGRRRVWQVILSSLLGSVPGCMGGFASVSMYNHGMISFGALVAMMIASSGDEAFVMLAMFPEQSAWIFLLLFVVAVAVGLVINVFHKGATENDTCHSMEVHAEDVNHAHEHECRHFGWKRIVLILGTLLFIAALLMGLLEEGGDESDCTSFSLLSEEWMYWLFSILSLVLIAVLCFAKDHFVEEHLWHHIVCHHLPGILAWTAGTVFVVGLLMQSLDLNAWISDNTAIMILLAALVGLIPESGPHLVFVTMFAAGVVPMPVLLASCVSQDGHASLPLLAESRSSWLKAKLVNLIVALAIGYISLSVGF